jgi:hypothetical protein
MTHYGNRWQAKNNLSWAAYFVSGSDHLTNNWSSGNKPFGLQEFVCDILHVAVLAIERVI